MVKARAGGRAALVWWDQELLSYRARINLFNDDVSSAGWPVGVPVAPWNWLVSEAGRQTSLPDLVVGGSPAQFLTVDALCHELGLRNLGIDPESWAQLLKLRRIVSQQFGDVIVRGSRASEGGWHRRCHKEYSEDITADTERIRLELWAAGQLRFVVCPAVLDASFHSSVGLTVASALDAARLIMPMVWRSAAEHADSVCWELALEVFTSHREFSLVAASIADWLASGEGLRWHRAYPCSNWEGTETGDGFRFRQLALNI